MSVGFLEFESLQRPFGRVYRNSSRFTVSSSTPYRTFSLGRARRDRNVPNFMPFLKILHNRISSNLLNAMDLSFNYQPPDNDITDGRNNRRL